ncbi:restriction endonuclease, partial [Patescibacteria group bacterium]
VSTSCKLHHWAFDGGLLGISDDYTILVSDDINGDDIYLDINKFVGKTITLPTEEGFIPHQIFLSAHRRIHGFQ